MTVNIYCTKKENIKTSCRDNKSKLFCKTLILQGLTKVCALTYNYVIVKGLRGQETRPGGVEETGKERTVVGKESKLVNH